MTAEYGYSRAFPEQYTFKSSFISYTPCFFLFHSISRTKVCWLSSYPWQRWQGWWQSVLLLYRAGAGSWRNAEGCLYQGGTSVRGENADDGYSILEEQLYKRWPKFWQCCQNLYLSHLSERSRRTENAGEPVELFSENASYLLCGWTQWHRYTLWWTW